MEQDTSYVPRSAKATDFKITLSTGAKEDEERVSFLKQQMKQAKDSYESSLKTMIEECIALEIQAAKKEESQLIMDLFPAIGKAIQQLQGTECSEHLQTVNALKMMPTLLQYGPIVNIINFLHFYQTHHILEEIPKPAIRTVDAEYATVEEWTIAMQHHTTSLQRPKNSGIQIYTKCLESILITPTASYDKQVEENKCLLNVKKLSNEIIMVKSTKDTAMELDGEGAASFEQLQDLIRKKCDKRDRKYARLEDKCNKLKQQVTKKDQKTCHRGASHQTTTEQAPRRKTNPTKGKLQTSQAPAQEVPQPTTMDSQNEETPKAQDEQPKNRGSRQKNESKPSSPLQNKSTRNPRNTTGKKKAPRMQQRKN